MSVLLFGVCQIHRVLHPVAKLGSNVWQAERTTARFLLEHSSCSFAAGLWDKGEALPLLRQPAFHLVDEHKADELEERGYQRPAEEPEEAIPAEVTEPLIARGTLTARAAVELDLSMENGWPMAPARLKVVNRSALGRVAVNVTTRRGGIIIGHEAHELDAREEMEVPISGRSALDA